MADTAYEGEEEEKKEQVQNRHCDRENRNRRTKSAGRRSQQSSAGGEHHRDTVESKWWPGKTQTVVKTVRFQEGPPQEIAVTTVPESAEQQQQENLVPIEDLHVLAVETRAQKKKKQDKEKKDEEATAASGVILSTPQYQTKKVVQKTGDSRDTGDNPAAEEDNANISSNAPSVPTQEKSQAQDQAAGEQDSTQPTRVNHLPEEPVMEITREEFLKAQKQDPAIQHMWQQARAEAADAKENPQWKIENGMLLRRWRQFSGEEDYNSDNGGGHTTIVVPTEYRTEVLKRGHDYAGHHGVKKTKKLVEDHFFWPGIGRSITEYCKKCPQCLKFNNKPTKKEPMMIVESLGEESLSTSLDHLTEPRKGTAIS